MERKMFVIPKILICILTLSMLAACGGGGSTGGSGSSGDVVLTYWTHDNPAFMDVAQRFADNYTEQTEGVTIAVESFPDFWTKVYSSLAAGTCGDVVEMYGSTLRFSQGGVISAVPDTVMTVQEIESTFYSGALANRLYNGKYYGLPSELNVESPGLIINVALLRDQGVEIPESWRENDGPATWDDLMKLAHELTIDDGTMMQAGLGVVGGEDISMLLSIIWQLGGEYRDPENMRVNLTGTEAVKAMEFIMDLITEPNAVHSATFTPRREGFMEGTIAMTIGAPWYCAVIDQDFEGFEYEYFNLPPFIDGANPYFLGEGGWGSWVPNSSVDVEKSWEFVKFMISEENNLEYAKSVGCLPANMELSRNAYFTSGEGRAVIGRAMQISEYGRDPGAYTIDPATFVWDIGMNNISAIISGQVSIQDGLETMEREVNEMIARMQEGELFED